MESKYLHKSVTFNKKEEQELKLWNWLRGIGHGEFNRKTREFWTEEMNKENNGK